MYMAVFIVKKADIYYMKDIEKRLFTQLLNAEQFNEYHCLPG